VIKAKTTTLCGNRSNKKVLVKCILGEEERHILAEIEGFFHINS